MLTEFIPSTKTLLIVAGIGAGGFLAYKLYAGAQERARQKKITQRINSEEERALMKSTERTIDDQSAQSIARALYEAMDGPGTDENAIYDILIERNRLTSADIVAVNKAFGVQPYGTFGSPWWGDGEDLNLVEWFSRELSNTSSLYKILQTKFNQAGIDWD